jgi:DNA-binding transcriptional LysR family regulator
LGLAATGHAQAIDGVVSISASDMVAAWLLPPVLHALADEAPGLRVEIVTTNALSDLRRREADIAVRHVRPSEPELIGRLLREATANFYAAKDWVRRHGHPRTAAEATAHCFIGSDREGQYLGYLRAHGLPVSEDAFSCYAENSTTAWSLVRQGLGIGAMMEDMAVQCPDVVRVLDDVPSVRFPIWLVTHRELHTSRRIRVVFDRLADALRAPMAPVRHIEGAAKPSSKR